MTVALSPDVVVYVCTNCIPQGGRLPRQWDQDGAKVLVREVPCSGKVDGQYPFSNAPRGGRTRDLRRRLPEGRVPSGRKATIGRRMPHPHGAAALGGDCDSSRSGPNLVHASADDPPEQLEQLVRGGISRAGFASRWREPPSHGKAGDAR